MGVKESCGEKEITGSAQTASITLSWNSQKMNNEVSPSIFFTVCVYPAVPECRAAPKNSFLLTDGTETKYTVTEFSLPHGPQLVRKKYNSFVQQPRKTHRCQSKQALLTLALKLLLPYSLDFPGRRDTNFYANQTQGKYFQVLQVVLLKSHHLSWVEKNLALEQFSSKNSLNKIHPLLFRSGWGD